MSLDWGGEKLAGGRVLTIDPLERKRFLTACAVPFLIVNLLFLKNFVLVESVIDSLRVPLQLYEAQLMEELTRLPIKSKLIIFFKT